LLNVFGRCELLLGVMCSVRGLANVSSAGGLLSLTTSASNSFSDFFSRETATATHNYIRTTRAAATAVFFLATKMPSQFLTCPYNRAHQIRPERMQYHLIKCRKQFPELSLVVCPYNATHHVPRADEHQHLLSCPDKRIVEIQKYRLNEPLAGQHGDLSNPLIYGSAFIPPEEAVDGGGQPRGGQDRSFLNETQASSVGTGFIARTGRNLLGVPTIGTAPTGGHGGGTGGHLLRSVGGGESERLNRLVVSRQGGGSVASGSRVAAVPPKRAPRETLDEEEEEEREDGDTTHDFRSKDFKSLGGTTRTAVASSSGGGAISGAASAAANAAVAASAAAAVPTQLPQQQLQARKPHVPLRRPKMATAAASYMMSGAGPAAVVGGITPAMTGCYDGSTSASLSNQRR